MFETLAATYLFYWQRYPVGLPIVGNAVAARQRFSSGTILLIGPYGAGKTTMRSLLRGFKDARGSHPQDGLILGRYKLQLQDTSGGPRVGFTWDSLSSGDVRLLVVVMSVERLCCSMDQERELRSMERSIQHAVRPGQTGPMKIFVLVHKADVKLKDPLRRHLMETPEMHDLAFGDCVRRAEAATAKIPVEIMVTSIWDESFHHAWCKILQSLLPPDDLMRRLLTELRIACDADEVVLLESETYLPLVACSTDIPKGAIGRMTSRLRDKYRQEKLGNILKYFGRNPGNDLSMQLRGDDFVFILQRFTACSIIVVVASSTHEMLGIQKNISRASSQVPVGWPSMDYMQSG